MPDRQDGQNKRITRTRVLTNARTYFNRLMQTDFLHAKLVDQSDLLIEVEEEGVNETELGKSKGRPSSKSK